MHSPRRPHSKYHACWWPSDSRKQDTSTNLVLQNIPYETKEGLYLIQSCRYNSRIPCVIWWSTSLVNWTLVVCIVSFLVPSFLSLGHVLINSLDPERCSCNLNSLWPSDAIWRQRSGSRHYLNQCWLLISEVQWHSYKGSFTSDASTIYHKNLFENYISKISFNELNQ